jgi:hypothetical protein
MIIAAAALAGALVSTSAEAAAWTSFGYPAQHMDHIGTKNADDSAAINLDCRPGSSLVMVQMRDGPPQGKTMLTLLVDGRAVARHAATVGDFGGVSTIEFGGEFHAEGMVVGWLDGLARTTSDVAVSAGRHVAHFSADNASNAARTALSYCKLR